MPLSSVDEGLSEDGEPITKRIRFASDSVSADPAEPLPDEVGLVVDSAKLLPEEAGLAATIDVDAVLSVERRGKYDICEAFSPPRVAARARERGLRDGWSLDIRDGDSRTKHRWNLADSAEANKAFEMLKRDVDVATRASGTMSPGGPTSCVDFDPGLR